MPWFSRGGLHSGRLGEVWTGTECAPGYKAKSFQKVEYFKVAEGRYFLA